MKTNADRFRVAVVLNHRGCLLSTGVTAGDTGAGARYLLALEKELSRFSRRAREIAAHQESSHESESAEQRSWTSRSGRASDD